MISTRPPVLLRAVLLASAALTLPARAADTLAILSLTPSSGPVQIVPGGEAATPAALTPANRIVARVVFPNAAAYEKVNFISIGASSIPPMAPSGQNVPRLVIKPFQKVPVSGRGPIRVDVEFGYACYTNNMHQITLTSIEVLAYDKLDLPPPYLIAGKVPAHLVVTCPLPLPPLPHPLPKKP